MSKNKIKIKTRLFINTSILKENYSVIVTGNSHHHLFTVLRCNPLDYISLFNEKDGEFLAQIMTINKKETITKLLYLIKIPEINKFNLHLAYAPLKKDANDYVIEKSCELNINEITQIVTQNTTNKPIPIEKITQKLILSAQQCGRLDIPKVNPSVSLDKFLDIHKNKMIFWLFERTSESTLSQYLLDKKKQDFSKVIFLIGPEGGFSESEINLLKSLSFIKQIHLNTNILRAETACIATLINFQVISCNF